MNTERKVSTGLLLSVVIYLVFFFVVVAVKTFILIFFSLNHEDFQNKYR